MLVQFAKSQFAVEGRGIVLVAMAQMSAGVTELRYLSTKALEDANLLALDSKADIAQQVKQALSAYDPAQQLILLFLYDRRASVYLLNFEALE